MTTKTTTFGQLNIGDRFTWHGHEYEKRETNDLPRYGRVNCCGPAFYDGDTGHRFLENDIRVEIKRP